MNRKQMSSRMKLILSLCLFAPMALIILTGQGPTDGGATWAHLGRRGLEFSLIADGVAWLTCLAACLMVIRLAHHLRQKVPFGLTTYILGLFMIFFGLQRLIGYISLWSPMPWLVPNVPIIRAAASVVVAMGAAVLFPYVRAMIGAVVAADTERERFFVAAESSLDAFFIFESVRDNRGEIEDLRYSYVNVNAEKKLQMGRDELIGRCVGEVTPMLLPPDLFERYKQVILTGTPFSEEIKVEADGDEDSWIATQVVKLGDGVVVTNRDVTQERARQHQIEDLNEFTQSMISSAPFSIIATDPAGTVTAMNPAAEALTFYRKHELIGMHSMMMLHDSAEMSVRAVQASRDLNEPIAAGFASLIAKPKYGETDEREWTYVRKDGSRIWVNLAMTALRTQDAKITGYLGIAFDITERKRLTDHVHHLAHHDPLTGLPNRVLLMDRMRQAIERAKRNHHRIAVLMVDIDHFKRINDSLGHSAGDSLLDSVAKKLTSAVRQTDTVARMGGDEFVIILPEFRDPGDAERCAETIIQRVATPTVLGNREVNVTVSVGVCIFPDCSHDVDSLLKNADAAMYEAKESGRNSYCVFNDSMIEATSDKLEFEQDLRHALERHELQLHYQPQVSCITGEVIGMEALLRWTSARRGMIRPAQFISVAEATGLILPIGEWAIRTACHEGRELQKRLGSEVIIAVNLSPRQFRQKNLASLVETALRESGLPAHSLEIEITENTLMTNSAATIETLRSLRELGVKIAIDDFGTGFSSFSYLLQYQVDRIKIDQSFVNRSAEDPTAAAIVRAIISMAHGLNLRVVGEGVETAEQLNFLLRRRCDEAQGYYFGRPVPLNEVVEVTRRIAAQRAEEMVRAIA